MIFFLAAGAVLAALVGLSFELLGAARREVLAQEDARREVATRSAMWRMDAFLATLLTRAATIPQDLATAELDGRGPAPRSPDPARPKWRDSPDDGQPLPFLVRRFAVTPDRSVVRGFDANRGATFVVTPPAQRFWDAFLGTEKAQSQLAEENRVVQQQIFESFRDNAVNPSGFGLNNDLNQRRQTVYSAQRANAANLSNAVGGDAAMVLGFASVARSTEFRALWIPNVVESNEPKLYFVRRIANDYGAALDVLELEWKSLEAQLRTTAEDLDLLIRITPPGAQDSVDRPDLLSAVPAIVRVESARPSELPRWSAAHRVVLFAIVVAVAAITVIGASFFRVVRFGERRGRFVSTVTHELRTPLTTFKLYAQMLADGMVKDEKQKAEYIETLRGESERLARVVDGVLVFSRIENRSAALRRERVTVSDLERRIGPALESRAAEGGMVLEIRNCAKDVVIDVDPQAVEQVAMNLVENAAKYASGAADPRIEMTIDDRGDRIALTVRDFGPGVAAGDRRKIFLPFERGEAHAVGTLPGVGLGLAIARGLAVEMGGRLHLVDVDGAGAAFCLELPKG